MRNNIKEKNPNKLTTFLFTNLLFKEEQIICQGQKIEEIFFSSGTTGSKANLVSDLSIYKRAPENLLNYFMEHN